MKKRAWFFLFALILALSLAHAMSERTRTGSAASPGVDLDLSTMSGTIVYSQVYNLMVDPTPYLGKVLRLAGIYTSYEEPALGETYHACLIPDALACCAQGIEFVPAEGEAAPAPQEGEEIVVTGRLERYEEYGLLYLHLVDATLERAGA